MSPFPQVWDATMISSFRSCPQRFWLAYVENWKLKEDSHHIMAGKAFAEGLEAARLAFYGEGKDEESALEAGIEALFRSYGDYTPPEGSAKTPERVAGALEYYFSVWPLGKDHARPAVIGGKLGIEFSFAEPLPVLHPTTGEPLMYCGRADQICEFSGGLFIEDDKTTSQLGPSWSRQWDLRSQFTGYCWAGRNTGMDIQGVIVRGVSILKTKYESAEVITYRPQWQVERWLNQVVRDLERAIDCWNRGYWDYSLDHACNEYGGCVYRRACLLQDPQPILQLYFERRQWNPLTREEIKLD